MFTRRRTGRQTDREEGTVLWCQPLITCRRIIKWELWRRSHAGMVKKKHVCVVIIWRGAGATPNQKVAARQDRGIYKIKICKSGVDGVGGGAWGDDDSGGGGCNILFSYLGHTFISFTSSLTNYIELNFFSFSHKHSLETMHFLTPTSVRKTIICGF